VRQVGTSACLEQGAAGSTAEAHWIPDMRAAASDEFGATHVDVRKCIAAPLDAQDMPNRASTDGMVRNFPLVA
jgi:hypothetical protein